MPCARAHLATPIRGLRVLISKGERAGQCLTNRLPWRTDHSSATVLDSHQVPADCTQLRRYVATSVRTVRIRNGQKRLVAPARGASEPSRRLASGAKHRPIVAHRTNWLPMEHRRKRKRSSARNPGYTIVPDGSRRGCGVSVAVTPYRRCWPTDARAREATEQHDDADRHDEGTRGHQGGVPVPEPRCQAPTEDDCAQPETQRAHHHQQVEAGAWGDRVRMADRRRVGRVLEERYEVDAEEQSAGHQQRQVARRHVADSGHRDAVDNGEHRAHCHTEVDQTELDIHENRPHKWLRDERR